MATKNNQWTKVISKKGNEVKSKKTYSTSPVPATAPILKPVTNKFKPVTKQVIEYTWTEHQKLNNCKFIITQTLAPKVGGKNADLDSLDSHQKKH